MNSFHRWFCRTSFWKKAHKDGIALKDVDPGDDVLEVGLTGWKLRLDPTRASVIEGAGLSNFRFLPEPAISEAI